MPKLKLELEELRVESFETAEGAAERGTVHGNSSPTRIKVCSGPEGVTCDETCGFTCYDTCGKIWGVYTCAGCPTVEIC